MKIKNLQTKESKIAVAQVSLVLCSPLALSTFFEKDFSLALLSITIGVVLSVLIWLQSLRQRLSKQIESYYENLESGVTLSKRLSNSRDDLFIIAQTTPHYYHLKSQTGDKQLLVSRKKALEEYVVEMNS